MQWLCGSALRKSASDAYSDGMHFFFASLNVPSKHDWVFWRWHPELQRHQLTYASGETVREGDHVMATHVSKAPCLPPFFTKEVWPPDGRPGKVRALCQLDTPLGRQHHGRDWIPHPGSNWVLVRWLDPQDAKEFAICGVQLRKLRPQLAW
jgi:hypothetical protein